jgi:uncharacterized protein YndB with AHSA1/START domain
MPGTHVASGSFVEIVPHQRIVFTWGWDGEASPLHAGSTTVVIDLEPEGDGTLVRLTHSDLVDPPITELHHQGWEHYLERLRIRAHGGDPGVDTVRAEMA